jgi:hypothetical protein
MPYSCAPVSVLSKQHLQSMRLQLLYVACNGAESMPALSCRRVALPPPSLLRRRCQERRLTPGCCQRTQAGHTQVRAFLRETNCAHGAAVIEGSKAECRGGLYFASSRPTTQPMLSIALMHSAVVQATLKCSSNLACYPLSV